MSYWNYRIVKSYLKTVWNTHFYSLREVFYDDNGNPESMTENPIDFGADCENDKEGKEELIAMLNMALDDAKRHPILNEPRSWVSEKEKKAEEYMKKKKKSDRYFSYDIEEWKVE